jgi:formiminoglutamase
MSGKSSSVVKWFSELEPAPWPESHRRSDDPRLGEVIERWDGQDAAISNGRAVLLSFPQDEGVRRNNGRPGAAQAPNEIRKWLLGLTPVDCSTGLDLRRRPPLDLGNMRLHGDLEETQDRLGSIVAAILMRGAVPVVLGGGHETAYGHYLGYVIAEKAVAIINLDAHLDVRPTLNGLGHSGSPFRQALEHVNRALPGAFYTCLGAQPQVVSQAHCEYARERGSIIRWHEEVTGKLKSALEAELDRPPRMVDIYVTIDADSVRSADVPGVSAPNPAGFSGQEVLACARAAGACPRVASMDLVEINPCYDRDHQSTRWGALLIWSFLVGLAQRGDRNGA